ncbi:MAG: MmcQ/YjbR family DNA-binding protein [Clostridia bacterium]|nr:MmcQ/YjbR family DNA-binding protein [Clostridia bacterium]
MSIPNVEKLKEFGFVKGRYTVELPIGMTLTVTEDLQTTVMDGTEEYTLYKVPGAAGGFVGQVRAQVEAVLEEIRNQCCSPFKTEQAREIIGYIRAQYGDDLEFLWKKFPENAIARRKDNRKWYLALLTVAPAKLGLPREGLLEIVDLRSAHREQLGEWALPGYHMNKKNWITVVLDGTVPFETLQCLIDESYRLAKGK